jgi:tetratricopeptide (TPR) repeat protein
MNRIPVLALLLAGAIGVLRADPLTDRAIALYNANNFAAARPLLEKAVAADPRNAAACYYLGEVISERGGDRALEEAEPWLARAVGLAPENELYLSDYGGNTLELAERKRSLDYAVRGRNAMEKAIGMNPADFDAREGLMRFYAQAPWPLGSAAKARAQAAAIVSRDKPRGLRDLLTLGCIHEGDHETGAARAAYAAALAIDPRNPAALQALARLR